MFVSCTASLKVMISSLPWPAKLGMEPCVPRTAATSALMDCVRYELKAEKQSFWKCVKFALDVFQDDFMCRIFEAQL